MPETTDDFGTASFEELCNQGLVRLRQIISRHPLAKRDEDEMLSAGSMTLVEVLRKLEAPSNAHKRNWRYVSTYLLRTVAGVPRQLAVVPARRGERPPKVVSTSTDLLQSDAPTELLERVLDCCHNDIEEQIVDLRMQGYNDREIACELNMSVTTVNNRRREIYGRYQEPTS